MAERVVEIDEELSPVVVVRREGMSTNRATGRQTPNAETEAIISLHSDLTEQERTYHGSSTPVELVDDYLRVPGLFPPPQPGRGINRMVSGQMEHSATLHPQTAGHTGSPIILPIASEVQKSSYSAPELRPEPATFNEFGRGRHSNAWLFRGLPIRGAVSGLWDPSSDSELSTKSLEKWVKVKNLGHRGSGGVWLEQGEQGQLRVVKRLRKDTMLKTNFSRELAALSNLNLDNHFVKFLGWYENKDSISYLMEYIENGDLSSYLRDDPENAKADAKEITRQLLIALEILHERDICHRNLKPKNILIVSHQPIWVKISDFGLPERTNDTLRTTCGTGGYIAPELLGLLPRRSSRRSRIFNPTFDIWSLGSIVHELLTSQIPFSANEEYGYDTEGSYSLEMGPSSENSIDMFVLASYCNGEIEFPAMILERSEVGEAGIAFTKSLLTPNPMDRPSATSALQDPWLRNSEIKSLGLEEDTDEVSSLLFQAAVNGYDLGITRIFESPSRESINSSTKGRLFQLATEAKRYNTIKLLLRNKAEVGARIGDQTVLQWAAKVGHFTTVELLLENEVDVSTSTNCLEALQAAAEGGHIDIVQLLIDNKIDVNGRRGKSVSQTTLQAAAKGGHTDITKLLLDNNADVNAIAAVHGLGGRTALQAAAGGGHIDIVMLLLANKADVNATAGEYGGGRTALQAAAEGGHVDIFKILLHNGASVNATAAWESGRTTLQAAAEGGHTGIVKLLLDNKADVNAAGAEYGGGRTALQAAAGSGHMGIVKLLLENGADVNGAPAKHGEGRTALQAAAEGGHTGIVKLLLDNKADVNATGAEYGGGRTALQAAAGSGNIDIVKLLLWSGADANYTATDYGEGRTALQAASEGGHIEIVKLLLDNGADVNADASTYGEGRTALQAAAGGGHTSVVKLLLENKAHVNSVAAGYNRGRTALQAASEAGHIDIVKILLESKAAVNDLPSKNDGRTALQAAAGGGHIEIIKLLLCNNANVNAGAGAHRGRTALQAAAEAGHTSIVKLLLENNASVNAPGAEYGGGRTALQAAAGGGYIDIIKLLLANNADVNATSVESPDRTTPRAIFQGRQTDIVKILGDARHLYSKMRP